MNARVAPVGSLTADQVEAALLAATTAPSLHNSQPWRLGCTSTAIELYADHARSVAVADPDERELILACGAALLNLRLAIRALGVYPDVRCFPDPTRPDLLATVRPAGRRPAAPVDRALAAAIPRRRTNRRPFAPMSPPNATHNRLRRAAEAERAWLAVLDRDQLPALRSLVRRAHHDQMADAAFRAEWRHWTGRDGGAADGVPIRSAGSMPEPQDEWVLRDFTAGRGPVRVAGKDFEPDPLIVVVGSFHDGLPSRLQAGQAMQRVLLTATDEGLAASFLSQVVEQPHTRRDLRTLIGGGLWPQTVLRIGYGSPVPATPRRPLGDVLVVGAPERAGRAPAG
jgi:nitroreductase